MRLPFDQNKLGNKLDASSPFQMFVQYGLTPITAVDQIDHVERRFVFRRIGSLSLIVSVGLANDAIRASALAQVWPLVLYFLICVVPLGLLARRFSREKHGLRGSGTGKSGEIAISHNAEPRVADAAAWRALPRGPGVKRCWTQPRPITPGNGDRQRRTTHARCRQSRAGLCEDRSVGADAPHAADRRADPGGGMRGDRRTGARARGFETKITFAPSVPSQFVTDSVQLRQILVNLLSNAVKYTLEGTVELRSPATCST